MMKKTGMRVSTLALMFGMTLGGSAMAADLGMKDTYAAPAGGTTYIVTIGGYVIGTPSFIGSKNSDVGFNPIVEVRQKGAKEWIGLPSDSFGWALAEGHNYRIGVAGSYVAERKTGDDRDALRGLREIDTSYQAGGFLEYYPVPNLRTRAELLQNFGGNDGFVANLSADLLLRTDSRTLFNFGPRLKLASDGYVDNYFSISADEAARTGLKEFKAGGGLNEAGVGAGVRYQLSQDWSARGYVEYRALVGDAADSEIVKKRGSENQLEGGIGFAYSFPYRR
jgi:outer membrane protein